MDGRKVSKAGSDFGRTSSLGDNKVVVQDVDGQRNWVCWSLFTGRRARELDVLVTQTAETRTDLADLYDFPRVPPRERNLRWHAARRADQN